MSCSSRKEIKIEEGQEDPQEEFEFQISEFKIKG